MQTPKSSRISSVSRWGCFLVLLAVAIGWAAKSVLARAASMKIADTSPQAFSTAAVGTHLEAVVRIDQVAGTNLKCTLLEKLSETTYRRARTGANVSAALTSGTSVVMGTSRDVIPGAIAQLAGTIDRDHVLTVTRVVILTGYVHLVDDLKPAP
jgi:hypothetical protein